MPRILQLNEGQSTVPLSSIHHDYDYPEGLDLKPGSKLHERIKTEVLRRATDSAGHISDRFTSWNNIDDTLVSYIDTDSAEDAIKYKDHRKPVSIVYPYSYAILETLLGYFISAFCQEPYFRYEGVSAEDVIGAILLEKIVDLHCNKWKILLNLHTMFRDSFAYGFGIVAPSWKKKFGKKIISGVQANQNRSRSFEDALLFEGNALANIDPYKCLPDPNVSISNVQEGEYFGWVDSTNYLDLLSEEQHSDGGVFNTKYLRQLNGKRTSIYTGDNSRRNRNIRSTPGDIHIGNPYDQIYMYIKLIPSEWELGKSEYPEKWLFSLAADQVVTKAQPLGIGHGMFPIAVAAPDYDGYGITPVSRLETLYGLQHTLNWMFNAHVQNVRKVINDTLIVDPYLINVPDIEDAKEGGVVRTRRPAWGRGVKDSIMQLAVSDVTRGHVADASIIREAMDKIGATDSWTMGSLRSSGPERLTGKEFEGTQKGGFTRLERVAKIVGVQAMQDIGYMFAYHTQQFMTEEVYIKTTGRSQERLMMEYGDTTHLKVSPYDLLIDYDLKVRDGSVPGGNYSGVWENMFKLLTEHPELQQKFDIMRIFKHILRNNGAKNTEEFIKVQQLPDEQVAQQAQAGNLVPSTDIGV